MRILAVDDERDTLAFLKDILVPAGHKVTPAASAVEALMHVQIGAFDLILLDIMMPGIDGLQLAQSLSANWDTFEIPIVVISCRRDREAKSWAKVHGCVRYIEKPLSPAELLDAVSEIETGQAEAMPT